MKNYPASVMARLKDKMRATKEPLNFLKLQYVQERFLYRLSLSEYKEQYILKGGTLFYIWADMKYRPTKDLDFMFYGSLDRNTLLKQLINICRQPFPEDGIDFQLDTFSYEAIRVTFNHRNTQIPDVPSRVWTDYFYDDDNKQRQWNAFIKRNKILNRPTLKEVCQTIGDYINPSLQLFHSLQIEVF